MNLEINGIHQALLIDACTEQYKKYRKILHGMRVNNFPYTRATEEQIKLYSELMDKLEFINEVEAQ